ncbi:uncharacterized protein LOC142938848 isoform X1 [Anarhichas minor]|uniref:uncharacterized protein LOC142938848 isoform X1 n=1 Tax=Anarhichas minor TaxID=65739 RepID=UPI003F737740
MACEDGHMSRTESRYLSSMMCVRELRSVSVCVCVCACLVSLSSPASRVCCQQWAMCLLWLSVIKPLITFAVCHKHAALHSLQDVSHSLSLCPRMQHQMQLTGGEWEASHAWCWLCPCALNILCEHIHQRCWQPFPFKLSSRFSEQHDLDFRYFWKWSAFEDYLLFCFGFTVLCAIITLLLLDSVMFVETLGSLAVMFEAMLGLPQLLQNFHNRSTKGMSVKMVLLWTAGDVFKTAYFVMNESPSQFWVCGFHPALHQPAVTPGAGLFFAESEQPTAVQL